MPACVTNAGFLVTVVHVAVTLLNQRLAIQGVLVCKRSKVVVLTFLFKREIFGKMSTFVVAS